MVAVVVVVVVVAVVVVVVAVVSVVRFVPCEGQDVRASVNSKCAQTVCIAVDVFHHLQWHQQLHTPEHVMRILLSCQYPQ